MKLDHIGIAVHSIEEALRSYQVAMGLEMEAATTLEEHKVRVAMLPVGESRIELLEAPIPPRPSTGSWPRGEKACTTSASRSGTWIKSWRLSARPALRPFPKRTEPVTGAAESPFSTPRSTHGVLIELVED